jgi:glutathione peroxidase
MRDARRMQLTRFLPLLLVCSSCSGFFSSSVPKAENAQASSVHTLTVADLDGQPVELARYKGQVLLVVNVASECGFTPQYEGLEKLERDLTPKGFHVLGFPCNDFGGQEPGGASEIRKFCTEKYAVSFPLFAKVKVKDGEGQAPLYKLLGGATGKLPGWNFCKYVVGKDGTVREFFASTVKPEDAELRAAIEKALAEAG